MPLANAPYILGNDKPTMIYGPYSGGASLETKEEAIETLAYPRVPLKGTQGRKSVTSTATGSR